jgi:transcriptional antiterminator RfaH
MKFTNVVAIRIMKPRSDLRPRERGGLIELAKQPRFRPGDRVRIVCGSFANHLALYAGQTAHERVAVLLQILGSQQRAELPAAAIAPVEVVR